MQHHHARSVTPPPYSIPHYKFLLDFERAGCGQQQWQEIVLQCPKAPADDSPRCGKARCPVRAGSPLGNRVSSTGGSATPVHLVKGMQIDYFSPSSQCWMPAVVGHVDEETGAAKIDVREEPLTCTEQRLRVRPRTKPAQEHLGWLDNLLLEGRVEEVAAKIFMKHASPDTDAGNGAFPRRLLRPDSLLACGNEIDGMLGVSGTPCVLRFQALACEDYSLKLDHFRSIFWELLWGTRHEYAMALNAPGQRCETARHDPGATYELDRELGSGTYGTVRLARHRETGALRAIKTVRKENSSVELQILDPEVEHLRRLDHPHIVKMYEHFEDARHVYIVMDFCAGGDLQGAIFSQCRSNTNFDEAFVADVLRQILRAISHVHSHGIVHLDLKSANIMLTASQGTLPPARRAGKQGVARTAFDRPHVMVIDLGVAQIFKPGNFRCNRPMGTPVTMAPEVWRGQITPKADVFSCGVVLFELLALRLPFSPGCEEKEARRYWAGKPQLPWYLAKDASASAKELAETMTRIDRNSRPVASACFQSAFLAQPGGFGRADATIPDLPEDILRRLAKFETRSVLYRSVALSIAGAWPANQLPTIKRVFEMLDTKGLGRLHVQDLADVFFRIGLTRQEAKSTADSLDLSRDGTVDWTEFVAGCIHLGSDALEDDLRFIFKDADVNDDGYLDEADLGKLLHNEHTQEVSIQEVFACLTKGRARKSHVNFRDFRKHFRTQNGLDEVPEEDEKEDKQGAPRPPPTNAPTGDSGVASGGIMSTMLGKANFLLIALREAGGAPGTREEHLKMLRDMGFTDEKQCLHVLERHRNRFTSSVVEELVALQEQLGAVGRGRL